MDYSKIVEDTKAKLRELLARRDALDKEILANTKILEGAELGAQSPSEWNPGDPKFVAQVVPLAESEPTKFADKVRLVLRKAGGALYPTEIRDRLESMGVEATTPKHLLIHVHKVLERFLENDEVIQETRDEKTAYRMLTKMEIFSRVLSEQSKWPFAKNSLLSGLGGENPNPNSSMSGLGEKGEKKK